MQGRRAREYAPRGEEDVSVHGGFTPAAPGFETRIGAAIGRFRHAGVKRAAANENGEPRTRRKPLPGGARFCRRRLVTGTIGRYDGPR